MLSVVIYLLVYYILLLDSSEPNMANYELYILQYWEIPKVEHNIEIDTYYFAILDEDESNKIFIISNKTSLY